MDTSATTYQSRVRAIGDRLLGRVFKMNDEQMHLITEVDLELGFARITSPGFGDVRMSVPEVMWWLMRDREHRERHEAALAIERLSAIKRLEELAR